MFNVPQTLYFHFIKNVIAWLLLITEYFFYWSRSEFVFLSSACTVTPVSTDKRPFHTSTRTITSVCRFTSNPSSFRDITFLLTSSDRVWLHVGHRKLQEEAGNVRTHLPPDTGALLVNIGWSDEKAFLRERVGGWTKPGGKWKVTEALSLSSVDPAEVNPAASVQTDRPSRGLQVELINTDRTSQQWKLKVIKGVTHFLSNITWRSLFKCGKSRVEKFSTSETCTHQNLLI